MRLEAAAGDGEGNSGTPAQVAHAAAPTRVISRHGYLDGVGRTEN